MVITEPPADDIGVTELSIQEGQGEHGKPIELPERLRAHLESDEADLCYWVDLYGLYGATLMELDRIFVLVFTELDLHRGESREEIVRALERQKQEIEPKLKHISNTGERAPRAVRLILLDHVIELLRAGHQELWGNSHPMSLLSSEEKEEYLNAGCAICAFVPVEPETIREHAHRFLTLLCKAVTCSPTEAKRARCIEACVEAHGKYLVSLRGASLSQISHTMAGGSHE